VIQDLCPFAVDFLWIRAGLWHSAPLGTLATSSSLPRQKISFGRVGFLSSRSLSLPTYLGVSAARVSVSVSVAGGYGVCICVLATNATSALFQIRISCWTLPRTDWSPRAQGARFSCGSFCWSCSPIRPTPPPSVGKANRASSGSSTPTRWPGGGARGRLSPTWTTTSWAGLSGKSMHSLYALCLPYEITIWLEIYWS